MSDEWRSTHCRVIGDIEICVYDHGGADINWVERSETDSLFPISAEHRQAVALALIGGVTDELVDRIADDCWDVSPRDRDPRADGIRQMVRTVVNAVFGITP